MAQERPPDERSTGAEEAARQMEALRRSLDDSRARERRWRSRELRYVAAARLAGLGVWRWHPPEVEMEWSDEVYRLLGYVKGERPPSYEAFVKAFHPGDQSALLLGFESVFTKVNPFPIRLRISDGAGHEREVLANGEVWIDPDTGERELVGTLQDVSALPQAARELDENVHWLRLIVETIPDAFWINTLGAKKTLYVSPGYERLWGRSIESLYENPSSFLDNVLPEDRRRLEEVLTHHWRGQAYEIDYRILRAGGVVRIRERGFPVKDENGRVWAMVGNTCDISGIEAVSVLRGKEYADIADLSPDIIMRFDTRLRTLFVNRAGEKAFGITRAEALEKFARDLQAPFEMGSLWEAKMQAAREFNEFQSFESHAIAPGDEREFETRIVPQADAAGHVDSLLTMTRDVTEAKRAREALWRRNEKLQRTLEEMVTKQEQRVQAEKLSALGTLAAGVAHELNNPLMGVMNYVEYARLTAANEKVQEVLGRATRELERIRDLLQNMLAFARPIDEGAGELGIENVLTKVFVLMHQDFVARRIELQVDIEPNLPSVRAKEGHLQQVLVNVLMNARDALEDCTEKIVRIRAYRLGSQVAIEIHDSGPGVPAPIRGRIFDPFFTTKPPGKGTGLGLSISRAAMVELNGDLRLASADGAGATFVVTVPIAQAGNDAGE